MQQLFFEQPLMLGICGLAIVIAAIFYWIQSGTRLGLLVAGIAAIVTLVLVVVCIRIETDRESIRRTIGEVAAALAENDLERVYRFIHPAASLELARARDELPKYHFTDARVTRLKSITVDRTSLPPKAIAEFNVVVAVEIQSQQFKGARFVKVYFTQQDGRWLVRDYEHFEPTAGFRD